MTADLYTTFEKISFYSGKALLLIVFLGFWIVVAIYVYVTFPKHFTRKNPEFTFVFTMVATAFTSYLASVGVFSMRFIEPIGFVSEIGYHFMKYGSIFLLMISGSLAIYFITVPAFQTPFVKTVLFTIIWSPMIVFLAYEDGIWIFLDNLSTYRFIPINVENGEPADGVLDNFVSFAFFFALISTHLQYFFEKARIWTDVRRVERSETTFHAGSIDLFLLFLSVSLALIVALLLSGANLISVSIFSGVLAAGFSIAFRELLNNVVAGVILYLDNSLRSGHVIELADGWVGKVKQFTLRYTQLEDRDKIEALIPNGRLINEKITNYSRDSKLVRLAVEFPLPLGSDFGYFSKPFQNAALRCKRVHKGPNNPPKLFLLSHSHWATHVQLRFWITTPEDGIANIKSEVMIEVGKTLKDLGVDFPQPHLSFEMARPRVE